MVQVSAKSFVASKKGPKRGRLVSSGPPLHGFTGRFDTLAHIGLLAGGEG
jgi:hypothetical protein